MDELGGTVRLVPRDPRHDLEIAAVSPPRACLSPAARILALSLSPTSNTAALRCGCARSLTGAQPPTFQNAEVGPALDRLVGSADSLLASDVRATHPVVGVVRAQTTCNGDTCGSIAPSPVDFQITISTSDLEYADPAADYQAIGTHHGVRISQGEGPTEISGYSLDRYGYGGWLNHSFFVVESAEVSAGLLQGTMLGYSYSVGEATGSSPAAGGGGSWTGVMVGMDVSGTAARGPVVHGDAEISIDDFADPMVGVAFTNIYNLDSDSRYGDMTWSDLTLTNGSFEDGTDGDSISGRFYGPGHEEVGGVFERNEILGAFGGDR